MCIYIHRGFHPRGETLKPLPVLSGKGLSLDVWPTVHHPAKPVIGQSTFRQGHGANS